MSLLNIFDSRGRGFNLLEALIEQEVANTGKKKIVTCLIYTSVAYEIQRMSRNFFGGTALQRRCFPCMQNGKDRDT